MCCAATQGKHMVSKYETKETRMKHVGHEKTSGEREEKL